ncbi:MAG: hypothetical protein U9Q12_02270, partial [Patescibacteria group bacterium]|nr:hypothetical protein [Patescibacteria group bacterium]
MSQQEQKKKDLIIWILALTALILVFIFVILLLIAGYVLFSKITKSTPTDTPPIENVLNEYYGYIEGSLGYPSDYIPAMGICAENKDTKEEFCTYKLIGDSKYTYDIGYILQVPAGTYNVYAHLVDEETGSWLGDPYKAYYSDYVICDADIFECTSHRPIDVIVDTNQTTSKI